MRKSYMLEELDCAICAAKIEQEVGSLAGVNKCSVSLLAQKMTLDIVEEIKDSIEVDVKRIVKKFEPDVEVIEK